MNMYLALGATVCLAIFCLTTFVTALLANLVAGSLRCLDVTRISRLPALLFIVRISPLLVGAFVTLGFAVPSFILLEPRHTVETPEPYLLALAAAALLSICVVIFRCAHLVSATNRLSRKWLRKAQRLDVCASIPVYRIESPESLVAVTGIIRPRVFVGRQALATLTEEELKAAIAHELAHVRSLDNLKQLILSITRLPRLIGHLAGVDTAWSKAAEVAADHEALRQGVQPLALASALVKIGRLARISLDSSAVAASHLVPPGHPSALAMRVEHLQCWLAEANRPRPNSSVPWPDLISIVVLAYALILPTSLPLAHRLIEWMVR